MANSRETAAIDQLVAAKDALREDPSDENKKARDEAADRVQAIRLEERRTDPTRGPTPEEAKALRQGRGAQGGMQAGSKVEVYRPVIGGDATKES